MKTRLTVVSGRQRVERKGLYFALIAKHRRSVYQQLDGSIELADVCTCKWEWTPDFEVMRSLNCVIDEHRLAAINQWRDVG